MAENGKGNPYRCVKNHFCKEEYNNKNCPHDKKSVNESKREDLIKKYSSDPAKELGNDVESKNIQVRKDQWRRYFKKIMDGDFYYLNHTNKRVVYIDDLLMIDDGKDKTKSRVKKIIKFISEDKLADFVKINLELGEYKQ